MSLLKYMQSNALQMLGRKHKTDKGSHHFQGVTYLHIYDLYFRHYRGVPMSILELGVKKGASIRMWRDYFEHGRIYGLDLNPKCKENQKGRVKIEIGYQDDTAVLDRLIKLEPKGFDIILDDCSHLNIPTIKSFKYLWPHVKSGGYYVIEDLRNSYTKDMKAEMKKGNWVSKDKQRKDTPLMHNREDMNKLFNDLIKEMDYRQNSTVSAVHFFPMIIIIGKA
jgi:hypothetical protein